MIDLEALRVRELAEDCRLDLVALEDLAEGVDLVGRDGVDHPLLSFADPDLGRRQAAVLERSMLQVHACTDLLAHLADRGAEAAGAAVGDRVVESQVARLELGVEDDLLLDRIADLHGAGADHLALVGQLDRGEGRPVDAVAPRAPTRGEDLVAGLGGLGDLVLGQDADRAAIDERVANEVVVHVNGAGHGRDAHRVAVVANSRDHAVEDPRRVQAAARDLAPRHVGRGDAEDVDVAERALRRDPCP